MNLQSWILLFVILGLAAWVAMRLHHKHKASGGVCSSCNATGCALRPYREKQLRRRKK